MSLDRGGGCSPSRRAVRPAWATTTGERMARDSASADVSSRTPAPSAAAALPPGRTTSAGASSRVGEMAFITAS